MADSKVTALSELSVPALEDLLYVVDDPSGTPVSNKVTTKRFLGQSLPMIAGGRLTLVTGDPAYGPKSLTPSSTDTSAETVTFASAHGWVTGTKVFPSETGGGLDATVLYYVNAASSTAVSFHTTLANAIAGTSKVNLTGNVTALLRPVGVGGSTLYYTPYAHAKVALYDGTRWALYEFTERSLALSSLTSGKPYDVFLYDNSGTLTLELLVWTDATTRATALSRQDGVWVKSGAATRRWVGTIYTTGTDTTEMSGDKQFVINADNRITLTLFRCSHTTHIHTYTSTTYRQFNNGTGGPFQVETILPLPGEFNLILGVSASVGNTSAATWRADIGVGIDATNTVDFSTRTISGDIATGAGATNIATASGGALEFAEIGYHYFSVNEATDNTNSAYVFSFTAAGEIFG